jgi:GNAT superfamily N-acetyltransferase
MLTTTHVDSAQFIHMIEENLSAKSMDFAKLPGGEAHVGNPSWFLSGLNRVGYNGIVSAALDPKYVDDQIESALEPFRQRNIPMTWWVGSYSEPANLGRMLQLHGLQHVRDMFGMAASLASLQEFTPPDMEYSFEPVTGKEGLEDWLPLFMETFGVPSADKALVLDIFDQLGSMSDSQWRHYLIRINGQVVATSSLHLGGGVAGLYNIATKAEYRKHGLGTAVTLLTYKQAQQLGYEWGTLQTTYPNALRLYHRMGFEVYCKIGVYQRLVW